jgi:hypothetical protein
VILSFVAVVEGSAVGDRPSVPVDRVDLARNSATAAPDAIEETQVVEHGLRRLAWLARDDPVVAGRLTAAWVSGFVGVCPRALSRRPGVNHPPGRWAAPLTSCDECGLVYEDVALESVPRALGSLGQSFRG